MAAYDRHDAGFWQYMIGALMMKQGLTEVIITPEDFERFEKAHSNAGLATTTLPDGIHFCLLTAEEKMLLEAPAPGKVS